MSVSKEKQRAALAFFLAALAGAALHFLYRFFPSPLTALFSPVGESVWEHVKLVYWPGLVAALWLARRQGAFGARLLALLLSCAVLLGVGYVYCVLLGGRAEPALIGMYLMAVGLAVWLAEPLEKRLRGRWDEFFLLLAIALGAAVCLFTFLPPDHPLYADLSRVNTWTVIPY